LYFLNPPDVYVGCAGKLWKTGEEGWRPIRSPERRARASADLGGQGLHVPGWPIHRLAQLRPPRTAACHGCLFRYPFGL